ncbi:hypothetical protein N9965_01530 [bacterium]|nr:hypothetical protein [bacterium]
MRRVAFLGAVILGCFLGQADEVNRHEVIVDFLDYHCYECHDSATQKGDREFEQLNLPLTSLQDLIMAQEIIDQVTLKEMPPKKKEQPEDEERLAVIRALRGEVAAARNRFKSNGGKTVMRRLSDREYENTMEVLFGPEHGLHHISLKNPHESSRKLSSICV